ncbi:Gfo/Idh/MocA family oxidoreductase [Echinicola sp. CAU 1574]|uniref:Gfo/Idh/MocA family oxidoreductase n=1 Tax=Echinicola arenosa TaxID=2774144 RepID=A0ABR9AKD3_9BACT|nr:Gfo/Idh/MocA family oxidoreductase [Echinicola arenosa]MBD8489009.1 Gfo/Idh/MocA family oxidoreductase [Echinicola arenosa]
MTKSKLSRRKFIAQTSVATMGLSAMAGTSFAFSIPRNDKVRLGFVGTGKQGFILLNYLMKCPETVVVGCSDVVEFNRNNFKKDAEKLNADKFGTAQEVKIHPDFRDLLSSSDIDAVVIATPDHWHAYIAVEAAKAGKDIYCEKPLAATVVEGRAMVDATRKYKRVFQTGNMQRSWNEFRQACELVRNGYIGEVKEVKVNIGKPSRLFDIEVQEIPEGIDWNMWVGPAEYRGYNDILAPMYQEGEDFRYPDWRVYRPYGGGDITDWGAHMFDIAQWGIGMDGSAPVKYIPPKDPSAVYGMKMIYDNGIVMTHEDWGKSNAVRFIGTKGTVDIGRGYLKTSPESLAEQKIKDSDIRLEYSDNHYQNWIDAIKERKRPICDVEIGHSTSALCNVVNIAYQLGRELEWNPKKEKFINDDGANQLLGRPFRGEWKLEV